MPWASNVRLLHHQPSTIVSSWIGISLGDITGIGPEVTLKALAQEAQVDDTRYILIGDTEHAHRLNRQLELDLPLNLYHQSSAWQAVSL